MDQLNNTDQDLGNDTNPMNPSIPPNLDLPPILKRIVDLGKSQIEKDMYLLGSITTFSACFPKIWTIDDSSKVFSNLYLFIVAPPASGKGKLSNCLNLVSKIDFQLASRKEISKSFGGSSRKKLITPGNISYAGLLKFLSENADGLLMFETEADTLNDIFGKEYGNYNTALRQAFHHEPIRAYRKTLDEDIVIKTPKFSTILSGTPKQFKRLLKSVENGLFSRFAYYSINATNKLYNAYQNKMDLGASFSEIGEEFYNLFQFLNSSEEIHFELSSGQETQMLEHQREIQKLLHNNVGEVLESNAHRARLITVRICMILTALRANVNLDVPKKLVCSDVDIKTAIKITKVLMFHAAIAYEEVIAKGEVFDGSGVKYQFLAELKNEFSRQDYLKTSRKYYLHDKTADKYIKHFISEKIIDRKIHNHYFFTDYGLSRCGRLEDS